MDNLMNELFLELIRLSLGSGNGFSRKPTESVWRGLYLLAEKHTVVGVAFDGVQKLPREQWPPKALVLEWIGRSEQIRNQNLVANIRSAEVTKMFSEAGFRSIILKGQGNALMYPNPLSRMSGDIDIWIIGHTEDTDSTGKSLRGEVNEFVRAKCPEAFEQKHHIEFPIFKDVEVEAHYTPGTLLSPKSNKRFQKWCGKMKDELRCMKADNDNEIFVPSIGFNVVYQVAHIMTHFFIEGIGLRHFIDYYYVLKANTDRTDRTDLFEKFGLLRFARGVMWIEKECLGLEDECLLVEPDDRIGRVIMKEMLEGGNFGHYDERYKGWRKSYFARGLTDGYRLLKLVSVFPSESMWKLYRKVENQKWKLR